MTDSHTSPTDENRELSQDAAFWCMRLHDKDCTEAERADFERWLQQSPRHMAEYQSMLEIWEISALLPGTEAQARIPSRQKFPLYPLAIAATFVALIGVSWMQGWLPNRYQRFATDNGIREIVLPDGSEVQLNRHTSLSFLNFRDRRQVNLRIGEAFFHVQHDEAHPFHVRAGAGQIVVTGTQFNVWKDNENVIVTLTEGSVKVTADSNDPNAKIAYLTPGQQTRYTDDAPSQFCVVSIDPATVLAWRDGKLILDNLTLAEALPLINRYLPYHLSLADSTAAGIRIGGIFETNNMQKLVDNLPKVLPVRLVQKKGGNILIEGLATYN